jgi:hypothetical protein
MPWRIVRAARETTSARGVSEITPFFRVNRTPVYFIAATPVNLLGLDRWSTSIT